MVCFILVMRNGLCDQLGKTQQINFATGNVFCNFSLGGGGGGGGV